MNNIRKIIEQEMLYYDSAMKQLNTLLDILSNEMKYLNDINPINHITTRIKSVKSIIEKFKRKQLPISKKSLEYLNDIVGARIVCGFIDDVYIVVNSLKNNKNLNIIECKDYIANPKDTGYRGYHIIIEIPISIDGVLKNIKGEIQIRTLAMDSWAANEHKLNYKKANHDLKSKKVLKDNAESIWNIDLSMNDLYKNKKSIRENLFCIGG